jgi:NAD-dependent dihydropyrimidine dehydrogenase PreA subunit
MLRKNIVIPNSIDLKHSKVLLDPNKGSLNSMKVWVIFECCIGCGQCAEVCPFQLFDKKDKKYFVAAPDRCIECSACKRNCPANAIQMKEVIGCGCLWDVAKRNGAKNGCC